MVFGRGSYLIYGLSGLLIQSPVNADRHCAPALDYYFQTRAIALAHQTDAKRYPNCNALIAAMADQLAEAVSEAQACGCMSLQNALAELSEAMASHPSTKLDKDIAEVENCTDVIAVLLDAKELLQNELSSCH